MEMKKAARNPLEGRSVTMEEVLKKKERFGEMIAEKERMVVLRELIDRNKRSDGVIMEDLSGEEVGLAYVGHSPSPLPSKQPSQQSQNCTVASSPDLEFYYSDRKNSGKFVNLVPMLDLSWLDNEDEGKEFEENERSHENRSFIEDSFSTENFHDKDFTAISRKTESRLSKIDDLEKSIQDIHFCSSGESLYKERNNSLAEEGLNLKCVKNHECFVSFKNMNNVLLNQPNTNLKINMDESVVNESLQIEKPDPKQSIEKKVSNDSGFQEKKNLTRNEKKQIEEEVKENDVTNNNHNDKQSETENGSAQNSKSKTNLVSIFSEKIDLNQSDFSCQTEATEGGEEENQNVNSVQGEVARKASTQSRKGFMKVSGTIDSRESEMLSGGSDEIRARANKEMYVMEGWKGETKKKESVARCYCFLCGVNCGVWFC